MKVRIEPIDYNVMKIKIAIYCDSVCAKRFELKSMLIKLIERFMV